MGGHLLGDENDNCKVIVGTRRSLLAQLVVGEKLDINNNNKVFIILYKRRGTVWVLLQWW